MADLRRIGGSFDILGESPVWSAAERSLYWADIKAPALRRWNGASGAATAWRMPEPLGSFALRSQGGVLLALKTGLRFFDPVQGSLGKAAPRHGEDDDMRLNDGKCDRQGRFWCGTMGETDRSPRGHLYRMDPQTGWEPVLDGLGIPNGLCWSPDGRTMYFTDSPTRVIWAYAYEPSTGALGSRRMFAETPAGESPDGATIDSEGFLWSARYGGGRVVRHAPDGRVDRVIEVPATQVTSCAFGGADLRTLFITTARQNLSAERLAAQPLAGALFAIEVGVAGLPEPAYAG